MPKLGPNPSCSEVVAKYEQLVGLSKTRSKAVHRKEALDAATAVQTTYPLCFAGTPAPGGSGTPAGEPSIPGVTPGAGAVPGAIPGGVPAPTGEVSTASILYAVGGVAAIGFIAYLILKPKKPKGPK